MRQIVKVATRSCLLEEWVSKKDNLFLQPRAFELHFDEREEHYFPALFSKSRIIVKSFTIANILMDLQKVKYSIQKWYPHLNREW